MKKIYTLVILFISLATFAQVPVMNSVTGPGAVCSAPSAPSSYTASATNSPTSYSWAVFPSAGVIITNGSTSVATISFPSTSTSFTVMCSATNGSGTSAPLVYTVSVFGTPNVTFSGATSFCQGSSTALQASSTILAGSPTISYNWSPPSGLNTTSGPNVVASPASSTIYTVSATTGICSSTATINITVHNNPVLASSISNTAPCVGNTVVVNVTGATNYTFNAPYLNNVPFTVNNLNTINILVTGTDVFGCMDTLIAEIFPVNPPSIIVVPSPSVICAGNTGTLGITGTGTSYSLNATPLSFSGWAYAPVSPTVNTSYTITASTTANVCTNSAVYTQSVSACIGFRENNEDENTLSIFPNPSNGSFFIKSSGIESVVITNELGQTIKAFTISEGKNEAVSGLSNGVYFIVTTHSRKRLVVIN
jgi:trimeric autotransporter adhesin